MGWVRLSDDFLDHEKFLKAGPLAGYLNIAAIAWSNRNLKDGRIPRAQVSRLVNFDGFAHHMWMGEVAGGGDDVKPLELAEELVDAGLWEAIEDGYAIHDYLDYQPSKASIKRVRDEKSAAGKKGAAKRWNGTRHSTSHSGSLAPAMADA